MVLFHFLFLWASFVYLHVDVLVANGGRLVPDGNLRVRETANIRITFHIFYDKKDCQLLTLPYLKVIGIERPVGLQDPFLLSSYVVAKLSL